MSCLKKTKNPKSSEASGFFFCFILESGVSYRVNDGGLGSAPRRQEVDLRAILGLEDWFIYDSSWKSFLFPLLTILRTNTTSESLQGCFIVAESSGPVSPPHTVVVLLPLTKVIGLELVWTWSGSGSSSLPENKPHCFCLKNLNESLFSNDTE